jgi:hypothetical protein
MLCSAAECREPGSYGVADGDAAGETDGEAPVSVFFLVDDFLVVVVDFMVAGAVVVVVVTDSFLLAHDDIMKPTATRAAMEQIKDCFIGCG